VWSPSRAVALRAAKRKCTYFSGSNVAAWASVEVTLLFVMMIAVQPENNKWLVDLPYARNYAPEPAARREGAMYIGVSRAGDIYFRRMKVVPDKLPDLIRAALQAGAEKKIYIYADARGRYAASKMVIDQIRLAGIERVAFVVEKSRVAKP
jgi:biopolymer transport protein ExbD